ncbi:hypothetical protein [Salinarimonas ramus]|uniref:Uncharacterized protein n=1 Tax=Salinarimonas ramus TaxID=690164 RepID=A0A917Q6G0_9HYPH|nr:hypothetical protein [Salinarimonas ramus]GGK30762.1 hypothetical protein GCM10011322_16720 [Salinarimonas ramus]
MPADMILISRFPTKPGKAGGLAAAMPSTPDRRILVALEGDEVVTLEPISAHDSLAALRDTVSGLAGDLASWLAGDIRRELLAFVEAPKPCEGLLPDTPFLQLRHVEVKPDRMGGYRKWRDETIFDVVRGAEEVESFLAYHSTVSGQPGVMFVSGFSVDPTTYGAVFASERYRTIVQEAGDQFITGGTDGLYTKIYQAPTQLAA